MICILCGKELVYQDSVKRIKKTKYGEKSFVLVPRYLCKNCHTIRRYLPDDLVRMKHYEKEVITGVIEGLITSETLGFEDYPSEETMKRWIASQELLTV